MGASGPRAAGSMGMGLKEGMGFAERRLASISRAIWPGPVGALVRAVGSLIWKRA